MTTQNHHHQVCAVLDATRILSPVSYSWFGRPSEPLPRKVRSSMTHRTARNYLRNRLQQQLYSEFYIRGKVSRRLWSDEAGWDGASDFVEQLSSANTGTGCSEGGWQVAGIEAGVVVIRGHELTLWVSRDDLDFDDKPIQIGTTVRLRLSKELRSVSPGFYFALGNKVDLRQDNVPAVRMYWSLKEEGAAPFLKAATDSLNSSHIPFRLKLLKEPSSYYRCDSAVLYVSRHDYRAVVDALRPVYSRVGNQLKSLTPAFTKRLAPGLAVAEDSGTIESFGQHRCRLLAEGIIRASERGLQKQEDRLASVIDCFLQDGIDWNLPYLNGGSSDIYDFSSKESCA